jgi:hypothetical protein
VYSDFYEIPLPTLRFEKVEETKSETTPKRMTPSELTTSAPTSTTLSKEKQTHSQEKRHAKELKTIPELRQ